MTKYPFTYMKRSQANVHSVIIYCRNGCGNHIVRLAFRFNGNSPSAEHLTHENLFCILFYWFFAGCRFVPGSSHITTQCPFGKPLVFLIHGLRPMKTSMAKSGHRLRSGTGSSHIAPQCPFGKPLVFLIHGLRPMKTSMAKSGRKLPVCPWLFSHCSLPTWTLYHIKGFMQ